MATRRRPASLESALGRWARLVQRTVVEASRDRITTNAASLAFHWFLAIFPAAIAVLGVIGLEGFSPSQLRGLVHGVSVLLPAQMAQTIDQALSRPPHGAGGATALVVGLAVALWSSIEAMAALQVGLDVAYEVGRDRGFVARRLHSVPLLALTVVLGGAASVLLVLGNPVRSLLPSTWALARSTLDGLWLAIRWAGALVLVILLLSAYYSFGPNHDQPKRRWLTVGAGVAAAGWMGASAAFSYYLDHFGHTSRTYGTFAGVAALLLWLFLTALAVLLGAELNCEIDRPRSAAGGRR
jgi:membrane protein